MKPICSRCISSHCMHNVVPIDVQAKECARNLPDFRVQYEAKKNACVGTMKGLIAQRQKLQEHGKAERVTLEAIRRKFDQWVAGKFREAEKERRDSDKVLGQSMGGCQMEITKADIFIAEQEKRKLTIRECIDEGKFANALELIADVEKAAKELEKKHLNDIPVINSRMPEMKDVSNKFLELINDAMSCKELKAGKLPYANNASRFKEAYKRD